MREIFTNVMAMYDGAIFEGLLQGYNDDRNGLTRGRGSAFGTDYIPIYDPLCPHNVMHFGAQHAHFIGHETTESPATSKKCCGGENPGCKGCGNCGSKAAAS